MLYTFATNIVACLAALFYPSYACYKLLSRRPCPEGALERWLMYWAVLGTLFALETVASPIISWLPFYHTFRMIFLISLAVNDGHLATFLYAGILSPFLAENEEFIDSQLAAVRPQITDFARDAANKVWRLIASSSAAVEAAGGVQPSAPQAPPPTLADPISGPASYAWSMFRAYAPTAIAGLASAYSGPAPPPPATTAHGAAAPDTASVLASINARRAALEAELAALAATSATIPHASGSHPTSGLPPNPPRVTSLTSYFANLPIPGTGAAAVTTAANVPLPPPSRTPYEFAPPGHTSPLPSPSASSARSRTPYDSEEERQKEYEKIGRDEAEPFVGGFVAGGAPPTTPARTGWWSWGRETPAAGYERVKTD